DAAPITRRWTGCPGTAPRVAEETGRLVQRRRVEVAAIRHHPADGLDTGKLAAIGPFPISVIAEDLAAEVGVGRLGQRGAGEAVTARTRVELAAVGRQRGHRIGAVGTAAVYPPRAALIAENMTGLGLAGLAGAGEQPAVVDGQPHDVNRLSRPATVGPPRLTAGVDAELDVAIVRLAVGQAGAVLDAPVDAAPGDGIVLAHQVAQHVVEPLLRVRPDGKREVTLANVQGLARRDLDEGFLPIEASG